MANLRDMVDGRTLRGAAEAGAPQKKVPPSPAAQHVANHLTDPFSNTKDDLDDLNQKRMEYEMKKQEMNMKLLPSESVTQGIRQMHDMYPTDPNSGGGMMGNPDPSMGMTPPGQPQPGGGMPPPGGGGMKPPMPLPSATGLPPGTSTGMTPQQMLGQPPVPPGGPPPNMTGAPGQPAQPPMGKPAMGGMVPGAAPKIGVPGQPQGPASSVPPMPPKMGVPQPGQGNPSQIAGNPGAMPGMPGQKPSSGQPAGGWKPAGNMGPKPPAPPPMMEPNQMGMMPPQPGQKPPSSGGGSKPPGSGSKSKKPGESKSKSSSGGKVNIHVHADSMTPSPAKTTQSSYTGSASLRSCGDYKKMEAHADDCNCAACKEKRSMDAYGTSSGVEKEWQTRHGGQTKQENVKKTNRNTNRKDPTRPGGMFDWAKGTVKLPGVKSAVLSTKKRKGLSKSQFVFPKQGSGSGSYPIPDANHARSALSLGKQHASPEKLAQIKQKVRSKFPNIDVQSGGPGSGRKPEGGGRNSFPHGKELDDAVRKYAPAWGEVLDQK